MMTTFPSDEAAAKYALLRLQGGNTALFLELVELCEIFRFWHEVEVLLILDSRASLIAMWANNGKGRTSLDRHNPVWKNTVRVLGSCPEIIRELTSSLMGVFRVNVSDLSLFHTGYSDSDATNIAAFEEPIRIV